MANLGSENTPIEGESFGLPSGYSFDEENGDLVIRDTDGTVVMRRADGAAWQLEGSDISGVGAFDSESVSTEQADSKVINGVVHYPDSKGDFSNLQDAVDFAATNGHLRVSVNESDSSGLTIPDDSDYQGLVIEGNGLQDFAPEIADVSVNARSIEFRNIYFGTNNQTNPFVVPSDGSGALLRVINCWADNQTLKFEDGDRHGIFHCDRVDVVFESGARNSVALGNTDSTFTDNDGSNQIPTDSNT